MATINLGNIKFNWKGTYNAGTAYAVDDVVSYNGSSYVCILASTNNLPTNTTYWNVMSSAGTDGTDLTSTLTTQGDILYRDGSGLQRLAAGTNGQVLQTGGSGANPSWADQSGGKQTLIKATSVSGNPVNIDFVHGTGGVVIDSTYDYYVIDIINCASQTDVHMMWFQIMQNGSPYTSTNYVSSMKEFYKAPGSNPSETLRHNSSINNFPIGQVGASNASGEQNMNVTIRYNPNGVGAEYPNATWTSTWWQDNNQSVHSVSGGHIQDTSGVNAFNGFRFGWHSNYGGSVNNTSQWANQGKVVLYGVKS